MRENNHCHATAHLTSDRDPRRLNDMFRRTASFEDNPKQKLELHQELESHEINVPASPYF
ncbi:hypothetical protein PILCRDRAFT_829146 [Piloderma croceum F 1598]|uniref:Uncharacterized protein n=1 Tax=Piloderma croceum (strain F 1598) TaxID=765440 RepID=A0A0C3EZX2_PILCF|nr:hypothetical protein PILCRDRAFT_829146 [Piloderma croceum F 1598]